MENTYKEHESVMAGPFRLGQAVLFEKHLETARTRRNIENPSYFAEFIVSDDDELTEVLDSIESAMSEHWEEMDDIDRLDSTPVYHNGKSSKKNYPTDCYFRAKTQPHSPPKLFFRDDALPVFSTEPDKRVYTGAAVAVEVTPVSYEIEDDKGTAKRGVYFVLDAVIILSDDKKEFPAIASTSARLASKAEAYIRKLNDGSA